SDSRNWCRHERNHDPRPGHRARTARRRRRRLPGVEDRRRLDRARLRPDRRRWPRRRSATGASEGRGRHLPPSLRHRSLFRRAEPGVAGELWSVHGGGFYRVVKYAVAPTRLPPTLHWFKWEAYATWLTGFALLVWIYYVGAAAYLVDPQVSRLGPRAAIAVGLGTLLGAWVVYDALCRSRLANSPLALGATLFVLGTGLAWGLTQLLAPRAAYLHVGAALGTIMAANVLMVIIPSQRDMVTALTEGRAPDAARGTQAALRSPHNNYFTLPVLFIMVSSHYPETYGHTLSWLILAALALVGVATRHWFNLRNEGRPNGWLLPGAALAMVALAVVTAPRRADRAGAGGRAGANSPAGNMA